MFYGYVGGGIKTVLRSWEEVERLRIMHPYSSYRKRYTEEAAWKWVNSRGHINSTFSVNKYGETFKKHFMRMEYIISKNCVYYNFDFGSIGRAILADLPSNCVVENRTNLIKLKVNDVHLGDSILDHLSAIHIGLDAIGPFYDIDIVVPDHSIFYALSIYDGEERRIRRVLTAISQRLGKVSLTLNDFSEREEDI